MAFRGNYDHSLDVKNRLTVPAKFRDALKQGATLVRATESCFAIWPTETYSAIVEQSLSHLNPLSADAQTYRRRYYANAHDLDLDSAGRLAIPAEFRTHAQLTKEAKVTGMGDYLEVWEPAQWQAYNTDLANRAPELDAGLVHPA